MSSTTGNPLTALASTVYLPAAAYGIGMGAAAPVMTLTALDLDAGIAMAGLTVALLGLGQVLGDLQAGQVVARLGERRSIVLASTAAAVGVLICILAPTVWWLCGGILTVGLANSVWGMARQDYLSLAVPFAWRPPAMSLFGGAKRFGFFVGPLVGAAAIWASPRGSLLRRVSRGATPCPPKAAAEERATESERRGRRRA